jgi:hypothetical protein
MTEYQTKEMESSPKLSETDIKSDGVEVEQLNVSKLESSTYGRRFSEKEEAAVIRKLDWHLMPLIFVLYSFSVLDRSNLGNAKVAGMANDINLTGNRYAWLGTIFYISC